MLVEKEAYFEVKRRLIGRDMDASDLVNSLLLEWLKKNVAKSAEKNVAAKLRLA